MSINLPVYTRTKKPHFEVKIDQQKENIKCIKSFLEQYEIFLQDNLKLKFHGKIKLTDARTDFDKFNLDVINKSSIIKKNKCGSRKQKPIQTQELKDLTYLSDSNYQIWRNSNLTIGPSLHKLKAVRKFLNSVYPIHRNNYGFYINPINKIQLVINEVTGSKSLTIDEDISIKLCGDGFNIAKSNLKIINFSFTIINQGQTAKTVKGNYLLGVFEVEQENYFEIKAAINDLLSKIKNIKSINIREKEIKIKFLFGADMSFIEDLYGLSKANSSHSCIYCKIPKSKFLTFDTSIKSGTIGDRLKFIECSVKDQTKYARSIEDSRSHFLKGNYGYQNKPIIDFIEFSDIVPDLLHLFIRISEKLTDSFINDLEEIDEKKTNMKLSCFVEHCKSIKITKPFFYCTKRKKFVLRSLSGLERKKLLSKTVIEYNEGHITYSILNLSNFFQNEFKIKEKVNTDINLTNCCFNSIKFVKPVGYISNQINQEEKRLKLKFNSITKLWQDFIEIISKIKTCSFYYTSYLNCLQKFIHNWIKDYVSVYFITSITPYMHLLVSHIKELISIHKNIDRFNCEGLEKLNDFLKISYNRSSNKKNENKIYLRQLLEKRNRLEFKTLEISEISLNHYKKSFLSTNCKTNVSNIDSNEILISDSENELYFLDNRIPNLGENEWLSDSHIDNLLIHLKTLYPNVTYYYNYKLSKDLLDLERTGKHISINFENTKNLIIILNVNNEHWITVTNIEIEKDIEATRIFVYDSLNNSNYLKGLKPLFRLMYPNEHYKYVNLVKIKKEFQQKGSSDCGLFALAYAKTLSENEQPAFVNYDQDQLRYEYNRFLETKTYNLPIKETNRSEDLVLTHHIISF